MNAERVATICAVRNGGGFDLSRYVERTFKTRQAAWKWQNSLARNVTVRLIPGRWVKGAAIPLETKTYDLLAVPCWKATDGQCYCGKQVTEIEPNVWADDTGTAQCPSGAWHIPRDVPKGRPMTDDSVPCSIHGHHRAGSPAATGYCSGVAEPEPRHYPYKNERGETVWACCESSIGPICAHKQADAPRPPRMDRNPNGSWYCWDCHQLVILFDDDEHDCEATGTSSQFHDGDDGR